MESRDLKYSTLSASPVLETQDLRERPMTVQCKLVLLTEPAYAGSYGVRFEQYVPSLSGRVSVGFLYLGASLENARTKYEEYLRFMGVKAVRS